MKPVYRHPLPSEGAMGEGYGNWCGFSPELHHFGLFFSKARMKVHEHNIHLPFQGIIIEEIEPQNCHADTCTKVSKSLSFGSHR